MSYKIAAASSDGKNIDLHFGEIKSIQIYQVCEADGDISFLEEREIKSLSDSQSAVYIGGCSCGQGFADRISETIGDCAYFLVAKIGPRPHRLLQENNVNCIEAPYPIGEAVAKLNRYFVSHKKRELHVF